MEIKVLQEFEGGPIGWWAIGHYSSQTFLAELLRQHMIEVEPDCVLQTYWKKERDIGCIEECSSDCKEHFVWENALENEPGAFPVTFTDR